MARRFGQPQVVAEIASPTFDRLAGSRVPVSEPEENPAPHALAPRS